MRFENLQKSPVQLALVVDELGHVEGIVTAADVLGAIAGDVAFSDGDGLARPQRREDGSWLIDGRMALEGSCADLLKSDHIRKAYLGL